MMALVSVFTFALFVSQLSDAASQNRVDTFTMSSGDTIILQSPNFPQNYPNNYRNQWVYSCSAEFDNILVLNCPVFNLEASTNCAKDRLVVTSRGQRKVVCGSDSLNGITTASGWMRLTFYSNADSIRQGFNCTIACMATPTPTIDPGFVTESTPPSFAPLACGTYSLAAGQEVAIQTTNFPQPHNTAVRCQWEFSCPAEADHTLSFKCPTFLLESSSNCVWDRLIVYSQGSRAVKCGTDSPDGTVTSTGWTRLTFFSNKFVVKQGFRCYIKCLAK